jgi:hypothetical protein
VFCSSDSENGRAYANLEIPRSPAKCGFSHSLDAAEQVDGEN